MGIFSKKSKPKAYYYSNGSSILIGFVTYDGKSTCYDTHSNTRWLNLININGQSIFNWPYDKLQCDPVSDERFEEMMEDLPRMVIQNSTKIFQETELEEYIKNFKSRLI